MYEDLNWIKAAASNPSGDCVQLAKMPLGVGVRDSKDPDGPVLTFSTTEIAAFIDGCRSGEFDFLLSDSER
jgi:hypothetical protein